MLFIKNKFYLKWRSIEWFSLLGDSFYYIALITYATKLPQSSLAIFIISCSEILPRTISIFLGALADATREKTRSFFQSSVVRGVLYILVGVTIFSTHSIGGIIFIAVLNAISDTFGGFASLCFEPFLKFVVKEDELEEAIGLNAVVHNFLSIFSSFIGATLLTIMSIHALAFFNAFTFFVVAVGVKLLQGKFTEIERKITPVKFAGFVDMLSHIFESVKELIRTKNIRNFFFFASALNSITNSTPAIIAIYLSRHKREQFVNLSFSIALIEGITVAMSILGSFLGPKYFTWFKTKQILFCCFFGNFLFLLNLPASHIWLGIICLMLGVFSAGIFNIRFSAMIMKTIPSEKMGTISASMDTFFMVFPAFLSTLWIGIAGISLLYYAITLSIFCMMIMLLIVKSKIEVAK